MNGDKIEGNLPCCSLTDEVIEKLVAMVKGGSFRGPAAKSLGISQNTFNTWIRTGREHVEQHEKGERAEPTQQMRLVVELDKAEGQHFVSEHKIILDGEVDVRDRDLRFKVHQRRFAKEWNNPATAIDDQTGEEVDADITAILLDRLAKLAGWED